MNAPSPAGGEPLVETSAGTVRGRSDGRVRSFLGIPYAGAPVGEFRFAPPRPVAGWTGVREASRPGPASPQPPSRLQAVVGPMCFDQAEDCLSVNVWTPEAPGRHPVLVWLHGGAYTSGSGGQDWYTGRSLARRGVIVVSVTYRLGALGFLYLAEHAERLGAGNFGLLDQLRALRWVRENIGSFGGDPDRITLAGQSAGALCALVSACGPDPEARCTRLILQSTPGGVRPASPQDASRTAELFLRELNLAPRHAERLRTLPVPRLLDAQLRVVQKTARFMDLTPPFQLVADGGPVPEDIIGTAVGKLAGTQILIGTTRDETNAWFVLDPRIRGISVEDAHRVARDWHGEAGPEMYARVAAAEPRATPAGVLGKMADDNVFLADSLRLADAASRAFRYRFDWHAGTRFGACHCIELPFVFGDIAAWRDAPMLAGPRAVPGRLVSAVQDAWAAFVRDGDPAMPGWRPHQRGRESVRRLDDDRLSAANR